MEIGRKRSPPHKNLGNNCLHWARETMIVLMSSSVILFVFLCGGLGRSRGLREKIVALGFGGRFGVHEP